MEVPSIIVLVLAVVAVIVIAKLLAWPIKKIVKLAINCVIGAVMLLLVNYFGAAIGITVKLSIINALIAGVFGLPGVIFLIILSFFI